MRCVTVINRNLFKMAFGRDVDNHDMYPQSTYLDRQTDDNLWLYECDEGASWAVRVPAEENREGWERIEVEPERYLRIPDLGHGDHYDILREFLRSDWTGDEARPGACGGCEFGLDRTLQARCVRRGAVHAFHAFQEVQIEKMAEDFLRHNYVVADWR